MKRCKIKGKYQTSDRKCLACLKSIGSLPKNMSLESAREIIREAKKNNSSELFLWVENLTDNDLSQLMPEIKEIKGLTSLYLSYNIFTIICSFSISPVPIIFPSISCFSSRNIIDESGISKADTPNSLCNIPIIAV
jgi:hypothetical protein